jgi:hypothetical protein
MIMTATWAAIDPDPKGPYLAIGCAKAEWELARQIPGCNFSKEDQIWRAYLTWPAWVAFRAVWSAQPIAVSPQLLEWESDRWYEISERMQMRTALDSGQHLTAQITGMEDGGDLHLDPIQRAHVGWLDRWRRCILADPTGNGKTPPLIRELQIMKTRGEGLPALVICPDSSPLEWQRKVGKWAPELRSVVIAGSAANRRKQLAAEADVYIIVWQNVRYHTRLAPYPGLKFRVCTDPERTHRQHTGIDPKITEATCEVHLKELNDIPFHTVIADECHRMADAKSKQTRAVQWMAHHAENFWAVTGTLTPNDASDLFPVLHAIDPRGWPSKSRYLDLYAQIQFSFHGGKEILDLRPDTAAYFHTAVDPLFRRIPRELARPGAPPRLEPEFRYPAMTGPQKTAYRQLAKEMLAELDGQMLVPDNHAVKFGRLVALASSAIEMTEGEDAHGFTKEGIVVLAPPSSKVDDLMVFLGDEPGQWVVADFSPALIELAERKLTAAKIPYVKIIGGMSHAEKDTAQQLFQANPEIRVCFLTAAGRESIDLYAAEGVLFLRPEPSYEVREQKIGRVDRRGHVGPIRQVYMVSEGTVDERLWQLGEDKSERHASITQDAAMLRWALAEDVAT